MLRPEHPAPRGPSCPEFSAMIAQRGGFLQGNACAYLASEAPENRGSFQKLVRKGTHKGKKPRERQVGSPELQERAGVWGAGGRSRETSKLLLRKNLCWLRGHTETETSQLLFLPLFNFNRSLLRSEKTNFCNE